MSKKRTKNVKKEYLSWFEIPVLDIQRAVTFFNYVYGIEMEIVDQQEYAMALFPSDSSVGGALVKGQGCTPSETGSLLYLNAIDDMDDMLTRVNEAGGRVMMGKTVISEDAGYFSLFIDSEGNRLAFHSNS